MAVDLFEAATTGADIKLFVWPIPGQNLDNRNRFNENTAYTVQRTTYSEWFWDP